MTDQSRCEECDRTFREPDGLEQHNLAKHPEKVKKIKQPFPVKKVRNWGIFIVILGLIIFGVYWMTVSASNQLSLPPTTMEGHIESLPSAHISKKPFRISIQKHMLEHVDGEEGGTGGIIINYDCINYECEPDLIEKLESFAIKYDHVYVAPFKNMPIKIALTKLGRIQTLDQYDDIKIETFITGKIPQKE